ncbi:holo-ACP synthase [Jiangella endophytica]|uniref:holo-ACP synthase n=1 Tax=Jiangella endophytica TaxID=1623398 RepID=UPI000E35117A|nr:holo-ACP synthase [Jiangella endophytica]
MPRRSPPEAAVEAAPFRVRVGVDIVDVARLERLLDDNPSAAGELFTAAEWAYCGGKRRRGEHLAARFAAKEAVLKAFGTGLSGRMRWTDVEIVNTPLGRPVVRLDGAVAARARDRGVRDVDVSLTHTAGMALAHAVVVSRIETGSTERRDSGCASI